MEKNTYMVYKINLETGKVSETGNEFEYASDAQSHCDLLNETQILTENIRYMFYYRIYNSFAPFKTQEQLRKEASLALNTFNKRINKLKALSVVATKSLLQGGLNKEEAV
jgi:hypothetical protein